MRSILRTAVDRGGHTAVLAGFVALALAGLGRPAALFGPLVLAAAVLDAARRASGDPIRGAIAAFVGLGPALVVLGVVHELVAATVPVWGSALLLQAVWTAAALSLGVPVATRLPSSRSLLDAGIRIFIVGGITAWMAGALVRLLTPSVDPALRLAWILGEEDNAQIVGIAREVLVHGPDGSTLASDFGTAFVNLPLALLRLVGGPLVTETDVRLQAVTVFVVSTILVIVMAGIAMGLIAGIPHHAHQARRSGITSPSWTTIALGGATTAVGALIGFSLLVVLPMRTGFLTFVWGLTLVLLAAGITAAIPVDAPATAHIVLLAHLVGTSLLLLGSWPFILPAIAPLGLLLAMRLPWSRAKISARSHPRITVALASAMLLVGAIAIAWFSRRGPVANILGFGVDLLTVGGSAIYADDLVRRASLAAIALVVLCVPLASARWRLMPIAAVTGPVAGAGLLYLGLQVTAQILTDGVLGYAGIKLLYGIVVLAAVLGLLGLSSQFMHFGASMGGVLLVVIVALHQMSPTAALHQEWWSQTFRPGTAHSEAAIAAIRGSSVDIPIRCLPSPGTIVTDSTRLAAYFCARWMEDAFNDGRFDGRRADLLFATGQTFDPTIERIEAEFATEYLFAYRMTMGPGWAGWNGAPG